MQREDFMKILEKVSDGNASEQEIALYLKWYQNFPEPIQLWEEINMEPKEFSQELISRILTQIRENKTFEPQVKPRPIWLYIAAAASIILVLSAALYFYNNNSIAPNIGNKHDLSRNDIPAGGNKAYITLGESHTIDLSSKKNSVIINPSKLSYEDGSDITANTGENIIVATPKGGTYKVVLPDGSAVWLNAASSIKFPSSFAHVDQRKVLLTGEAYFEVAKDKLHPFVVVSTGQTVQVLGTHFNISSYAGEAIKTTLLEGSVQINSDTIIKPGEQATGNGKDLQVTLADIESTLAWKNGDFVFNDEPLETIMRKIARWYNVEIGYQGTITTEGFTGTISRNKNISQVLEMIERTKGIHFKIEGRRVTVMQ